MSPKLLKIDFLIPANWLTFFKVCPSNANLETRPAHVDCLSIFLPLSEWWGVCMHWAHQTGVLAQFGHVPLLWLPIHLWGTYITKDDESGKHSWCFILFSYFFFWKAEGIIFGVEADQRTINQKKISLQISWLCISAWEKKMLCKEDCVKHDLQFSFNANIPFQCFFLLA